MCVGLFVFIVVWFVWIDVLVFVFWVCVSGVSVSRMYNDNVVFILCFSVCVG